MARRPFPHKMQRVLWLLLLASAGLAGALLLVRPSADGWWGNHVIVFVTLGGKVGLTLWLAVASTALLTVAAGVTDGFSRGDDAERALTVVGAFVASATVVGAVLVVSLVALVVGLALFLFGAIADRDNRA